MSQVMVGVYAFMGAWQGTRAFYFATAIMRAAYVGLMMSIWQTDVWRYVALTDAAVACITAALAALIK